MNKIWLADPETHDFPAAADYLELLMPARDAKAFAAKLKKTATQNKKAKDILRASELPLLPKDNLHVAENLKKFRKGKKLSPLLLVRGQNKLIIADGYHRICASYYLSEDMEVPCRLV
jgi:hypothetical protein